MFTMLVNKSKYANPRLFIGLWRDLGQNFRTIGQKARRLPVFRDATDRRRLTCVARGVVCSHTNREE